MNHEPGSSRRGGQVLAEGWRVFLAGMPVIFPWVLAAELIQELPFANPPGNLFDTDLSLFMRPDYLVRALICGATQAFFYGIAVQRLAGRSEAGTWVASLRAAPSVLAAYIAYEFVVAVGLLLTFAFFMLGLFVIGPWGGLVLCILPLAPTAAASTALALFIFPAVLEGKGPFAALGESTRLARRSWVKVSLVISVPAVALLLSAVLADFQSLSHSVSSALDMLRQGEEGGLGVEQVNGLLAGLTAKPPGSRYETWQLIGTVLGAFAWWYTLAVCYVQYRDLKAGDAG
ncbi:MAG: hypothetical protein ACM3ZT_01525 [Bacillota bacterium]